MRRRFLFPLIGALALLVVAFTLGQTGRSPVGNTASAAAAGENDFAFVATDVTVEQTDATGQLEYQLSAREVQQQQDKDPVMASGLQLHHDPRNEAGKAQPELRWTLLADEAQLPPAGGLLHLRGNVRAQGKPGPRSEPLQVSTDRLDYDTRTQHLSSDGLVTLSWGRRELSGRGLAADLGLGTIDLAAEVRGSSPP